MKQEPKDEVNLLLESDDTDARSLRRKAVETIRRTARSDEAVFFSAIQVNGEMRLSCFEFSEGCQRMASFAHFEGLLVPDARSLKPASPSTADTGRFVCFDRLNTRLGLDQTDGYAHVFKPVGVVDAARIMCYHQGQFAGWVGAFRFEGQAAFSGADLRRLNGVVEPVTALLEKAHDRRRMELGDHPVFLIVDEQGACAESTAPEVSARIYDAEVAGRVVAAISKGEWCLDHQPGFVFHELIVKVMPMNGAHAAHFLVQLKPGQPVVMSPGALLTPMQRKVADLMVTGKTSAEVAGELGISEETVKSHLRLIYQRLAVSNRIELVRLLSNS